ncbi:MAG: hypothetical protein COB76_00590 [Alphaproteobacteria bacterium]|nr:MAG: hypothetical protein COB76_00590 [Alphaproteobacteria bacterium]
MANSKNDFMEVGVVVLLSIGAAVVLDHQTVTEIRQPGEVLALDVQGKSTIVTTDIFNRGSYYKIKFPSDVSKEIQLGKTYKFSVSGGVSTAALHTLGGKQIVRGESFSLALK